MNDLIENHEIILDNLRPTCGDIKSFPSDQEAQVEQSGVGFAEPDQLRTLHVPGMILTDVRPVHDGEVRIMDALAAGPRVALPEVLCREPLGDVLRMRRLPQAGSYLAHKDRP